MPSIKQENKTNKCIGMIKHQTLLSCPKSKGPTDRIADRQAAFDLPFRCLDWYFTNILDTLNKLYFFQLKGYLHALICKTSPTWNLKSGNKYLMQPHLAIITSSRFLSSFQFHFLMQLVLDVSYKTSQNIACHHSFLLLWLLQLLWLLSLDNFYY